LGEIGNRANRAKALKCDGIKRRSKREGTFGASRFGGAAKEQARGGDIAIGEEIVASFDQDRDLFACQAAMADGRWRVLGRCGRNHHRLGGFRRDKHRH
jgi:hypothetical protein